MCVAGAALASHARPQSATPLTFQLVPSFKPASPCAGTVSTHGLPLGVPSCNPPVQTSSFLTAQDPSRAAPFTGPADAKGRITLTIVCFAPGTTTPGGGVPPCPLAGSQQDVKIDSSAQGVRCQVVIAGGICSAPNALYNGKVLGASTIQITDHDNTSGQACDPNCPGTVTALPFSVGAQCTGGACNYITSANLTVPGVTKEVKRAVVELGQLQVQDAGSDGNLAGGTACPPTCAQNPGDGSAIAYVQGLFVP
jgi:hypothetical protein